MRVCWLRLAPVFLGIFVLAWFVPQIYLRATRADYYQVSGMYSPVFKEFVLWETGSTLFAYKREDGTRLNLREGRMATPFSFPKDIEKWGGFPMEIDGRTITYADAQENEWARVNPRAVMLPMSRVQVLMESAPETSSYKLPPDIMLIDDNALRFVDCATGKENAPKGTAFTAAVKGAGARFPLQTAASNADPYKGHDEGMFIVDAQGVLFQLLLVKGQPLCRNTGHVVSGKPLYIDVKEKRNSDFLGVIATDTGLFLNLRNKAPLRLPISYAPGSQSVSLWITPLDATINVKELGAKNQRPALIVATDNEFRVVRKFTLDTPPAVLARQQMLQRILSLLTPFSIMQFEPHIPGTGLHVRPAQYPILALVGCVLSSVVLLAARRRAQPPRRAASALRGIWPEAVITLALGLPALVMLLLMGPLTRPSPSYYSIDH